MFRYKILRWVLISSMCNSVYAALIPADTFSSPELTAALGASWLNAGNTNLHVSPYETDALNVTGLSTDIVWRAGVGVHVLKEKLAARHYFNDLSLQLNFYNSAATINGNVWQYQLPQFNNYTFHASATNSRLMLDVKPGLLTYNGFTPYLIGGIGLGWNSIGYYENASAAGVPTGSNYLLSRQTSLNTTYDVGAGIKHQMTPHLAATLEYEYTYLGRMSPQSSSSAIALVSPPHFTLSTQNLFAGINWQI